MQYKIALSIDQSDRFDVLNNSEQSIIIIPTNIFQLHIIYNHYHQFIHSCCTITRINIIYRIKMNTRVCSACGLGMLCLHLFNRFDPTKYAQWEHELQLFKTCMCESSCSFSLFPITVQHGLRLMKFHCILQHCSQYNNSTSFQVQQ